MTGLIKCVNIGDFHHTNFVFSVWTNLTQKPSGEPGQIFSPPGRYPEPTRIDRGHTDSSAPLPSGKTSASESGAVDKTSSGRVVRGHTASRSSGPPSKKSTRTSPPSASSTPRSPSSRSSRSSTSGRSRKERPEKSRKTPPNPPPSPPEPTSTPSASGPAQH